MDTEKNRIPIGGSYESSVPVNGQTLQTSGLIRTGLAVLVLGCVLKDSTPSFPDAPADDNTIELASGGDNKTADDHLTTNPNKDKEYASVSGFMQVDADGNFSEAAEGGRDFFGMTQSDLFDEMENAGMEAWDVTALEDGYDQLPDAVKPFIRIGYTQDADENVTPIKLINGEALAEVFENDPDVLMKMAQEAGILDENFDPNATSGISDEALAGLDFSKLPAIERNLKVKEAGIFTSILILAVVMGVFFFAGKLNKPSDKRTRIRQSQFDAANPATQTLWSGNGYRVVPDNLFDRAGDRAGSAASSAAGAIGAGVRNAATAAVSTRRRALITIAAAILATGGLVLSVSDVSCADSEKSVQIPAVPTSTGLHDRLKEAGEVEEE